MIQPQSRSNIAIASWTSLVAIAYLCAALNRLLDITGSDRLPVRYTYRHERDSHMPQQAQFVGKIMELSLAP
ncbi:MAG: hypothetical protein AAGD25_37460 [Cyanobacteria bacterium P01_F01_bin.150]